MMLKLKNSEFLMPRRRHNKDGAGCMSGIVSIFHGRRRMLSDHITVGPSCTSSEVSSVTDSEEMHIQTEPQTQTTPRVKELVEEEMHIDHLQNHKTLSSTSFDSSIHPHIPSQKTSRYHDLEDLMNDFVLIHHKTKPNSIERSNSLRSNPTSDEPPVIHKRRNFFRRRSKSHECISLNLNDSPIPSSRTNSQFSFTEIKRMLKNAIARSPRSSGCRGKPFVDGSSGWNSPNREHFYSERFSDGFSAREFGDTSYRISNIYVEAKKHLSEMLSNGDQDTEMTIERHSRTLGKLLSFPEYNSLSASIGPRNKPKHGDLTTSPSGNSPKLNESQPPVAEDDHQQEVSDDVHQTEDAGLVKAASAEEIEVSGVSDFTEDDELSCSPIASPSGSSGDVNQKTKEVDDGTGKPSPVSILEPLFSDDDISPARTISRSAEASIQPRCIRFEENQETCIRNCEESAFEYMEAVLLASDLNWDEFEKRWIASIPILDSSLYDELEIFSSRPSHDQRLLFDSTNQILKEVCDRFFPFVQPNIHLLPKGMKLIKEVWERLESRLDGPYPGSLDQLIKKDLQASRMWMDLCWETGEIVIEIEESILEDVIDDAVLSFLQD